MKKTRLAVIGNPIEHSLSPIVHGYIADFLKAEISYEKICVKQGELPEFIKRAKCEYDGFNVTMPHKKDIVNLLDSASATAKISGCVNTVSLKQGELLGYNTDGLGFGYSLKKRDYSFEKANIVIMGAGGAAGVIAAEAVRCGAKRICIGGRTKEKTELLAKKINNEDTSSFGVSLKDEAFLKELGGCDILINATSLGMYGCSQFESFDFLKFLKRSCAVFDLIYSPMETKLIYEAKKCGHEAFCGFYMLVYQAIEAEKIFLNADFDTEKVFDGIHDKLKLLF